MALFASESCYVLIERCSLGGTIGGFCSATGLFFQILREARAMACSTGGKRNVPERFVCRPKFEEVKKNSGKRNKQKKWA